MAVVSPITILTPEQVVAIGQQFFAAQKAGECWTCEASIDDLTATILDRRARLRAVVAGAPEASFAPQPDNDRGELVWSAGQCADHIVNAQYGVSEPAIIALMVPDGVADFEQPLPVDEIPQPPALDRGAALARLDGATLDLERLLDGVPPDADLTSTVEHRYFGAINLKAILLITAWHEQGHAAQIDGLAT